MLNIENYLSRLLTLLQQNFGPRLVYVGLQGSYLRGEATENSDIDIMTVVDGLSISDLEQYRTLVSSLEEPEKSCGFICSKTDLSHWNPLEICHLLHSTRDLFGRLRPLVPSYTEQDVRSYVKLSINNLYHELCHRFIHGERGKTIAALPSLYQSAFFLLQNLYYLEHGLFPQTKAELLPLLSGRNHSVLKCAMTFKADSDFDFHDCFEMLFLWCQETLTSL